MLRNPHAAVIQPFVIRRLDTAGYMLKPQIPSTVTQSDCFLYLREGEVLTDIGSEPYLVGAGQFMYIPGGVPFSIKYYNGSKGYMGAFSSSMLKSPHLGLLLQHVPVLVNVPEPEREFISSLAEKLFREQCAGTSGSSEIMSAALDLLLQQVDSVSGNSMDHVQHSLCSRFLDRVFDRDSNILRVSSYAQELGVSPNHLNRVVKSGTGRSAGEWIDISRINLSRLLLRQSQLPIIDIALRSGFEDQSYFSRFFKKHTGMTPSEFRSGEE